MFTQVTGKAKVLAGTPAVHRTHWYEIEGVGCAVQVPSETLSSCPWVRGPERAGAVKRLGAESISAVVNVTVVVDAIALVAMTRTAIRLPVSPVVVTYVGDVAPETFPQVSGTAETTESIAAEHRSH